MIRAEFTLNAIPPDVADRLRRGGGPLYVADTKPGYPCRQCLRDADIGDELVLVSHDPFTGRSPYRSASPVFLHRTACPPYVPSAGLPPQLTGRQLSVRAFDGDEMMVDACVIDGSDLGSTIARLLGDAAVAHLHVYNATRGCWAARVDRR